MPTLAPTGPTRYPTRVPTLSPRNTDDDYAFFENTDVMSVMSSIQMASVAATKIANDTMQLIGTYAIGRGNATLINALVAKVNVAAQYATKLASDQTALLTNLVAAWKLVHGCNGGASCTDTLVATSVTVGLTFFNAINDRNQVLSYMLFHGCSCSRHFTAHPSRPAHAVLPLGDRRDGGHLENR
jgi:hypothetical protein